MDIATTEDVQQLVDTFYTAVRTDDIIGPVFNTIIGDQWAHHLPKMY